MATRFFSDEQMERLRSYPDIGREELIRFFTLTQKDLRFIDNLDRSGGRGPAARLGLAVQLCTLPWLGFVPDDIWSVPPAAVQRLTSQLALHPAVLGQYGRRAQTRSDHLKLVRRYLQWQSVPASGQSLKELEQFLLDRAMEHDTPSLLFHQAAKFLLVRHQVSQEMTAARLWLQVAGALFPHSSVSAVPSPESGGNGGRRLAGCGLSFPP